MSEESDHTRLVLIDQRLTELSRQVEAQTQTTADLVDAWRSAKTFLSFVQLLAKFAAAIGGLWLMAKGFMGMVK